MNCVIVAWFKAMCPHNISGEGLQINCVQQEIEVADNKPKWQCINADI